MRLGMKMHESKDRDACFTKGKFNHQEDDLGDNEELMMEMRYDSG